MTSLVYDILNFLRSTKDYNSPYLASMLLVVHQQLSERKLPLYVSQLFLLPTFPTDYTTELVTIPFDYICISVMQLISSEFQ